MQEKRGLSKQSDSSVTVKQPKKETACIPEDKTEETQGGTAPAMSTRTTRKRAATSSAAIARGEDGLNKQSDRSVR